MCETKNMMIYASEFNNIISFKMMPVTQECPFNECIYDSKAKILAIIGKDRKESPIMIPRLDDKGQAIKIKGGTDVMSERKFMNKYYEYYIEDMMDITKFIEIFAINIDHPSLQILKEEKAEN